MKNSCLGKRFKIFRTYNSRDSNPKALLFSEKSETTNLFKALAIDFKDQITFGQAKSSHKELGKPS